MGWLTRVRQRLPFLPKRETPDNLWHKCRGCGQMLFTREFEENLSVCPKCDFHERIGPEARFAQIFDDGRSEEHTSELQSLMRISYAVFCLKKNNKQIKPTKEQAQH